MVSISDRNIREMVSEDFMLKYFRLKQIVRKVHYE